MKPISHITIFIVVIFTSMASAQAQSPREQLSHMVEQLQKTPTDNALREKIIKLAQTVKPAAAIPEEALRYEGRARAAFQTARNESDYLAAAEEYRAAMRHAPWVAGYYSDLCTIYEKAAVYAEAKRNCHWALMAVSEPAGGAELKRRIAGMEFLVEKFSKRSLSAQLEKPFRTDIQGLPAGNRWFCSATYHTPPPADADPVAGREEWWFVSDGTTARLVKVTWVEAESLALLALRSNQIQNPSFVDFLSNRDQTAPRRFWHERFGTHDVYEISADGQTVTAVSRKGKSPAVAREEIQRWSCAIK